MFKKTHASITSGLTKMIKDLDALAIQHANDAINKEKEIKKLQGDIIVLNVQHEKCNLSASKLRDIVGEETKS
jgi:hypothetical protein